MGSAAAEPQGVGRLRRSGDANFLGGTGASGVVEVPGQEGFEVIQDAGHAVFIDQPERFDRLLTDFVAAVAQKL